MELNEIIKALKSLTDEQKAEVREALAALDAPPDETAESEPERETAPEKGGTEQAQAGQAKEPATDAAQPEDADPPEENAGQNDGPETPVSRSDRPPEENAGDIGGAEEEIPAMTAEPKTPTQQKDTPQARQSGPKTALADDQGGEMPVDYREIVDGLNAKNLALEAENKRLKAKLEGAFGLTAKPGVLAKVNPLFDNATDDIHFKK